MNLLFICKYNRLRSKIAEAYFKKLNKNKNIKVKSAGLIKGSPINPETIKIVKKRGISIKGQPHGISSKLLVWQNMMVIVADNVPSSLFNNKRFGKPIVVWRIKDAFRENETEENPVITKIMQKVEKLVKKLENSK